MTRTVRDLKKLIEETINHHYTDYIIWKYIWADLEAQAADDEELGILAELCHRNYLCFRRTPNVHWNETYIAELTEWLNTDRTDVSNAGLVFSLQA